MTLSREQVERQLDELLTSRRLESRGAYGRMVALCEGWLAQQDALEAEIRRATENGRLAQKHWDRAEAAEARVAALEKELALARMDEQDAVMGETEALERVAAQQRVIDAAGPVVRRWREGKSCPDEIALLDVALAALLSINEEPK